MRPGIDITDSYFGQPTPVETSVSFSLSYPAWVRLSHSKLWHDVEMEIDALQKNPMPRTILERINYELLKFEISKEVHNGHDD